MASALGMTAYELAMVSLMATGVATSAAQGVASYNQQKEAAKDAKDAQERAERKQQQADEDAERQRLEALASNQTDTDYGSVWGVDNANKYSDAAQKLSAGTGSFNTDDDEENPFYSKGLL